MIDDDFSMIDDDLVYYARFIVHIFLDLTSNLMNLLSTILRRSSRVTISSCQTSNLEDSN